MENIQEEDLIETVDSTSETTEEVTEVTTEQDPLKAELERVQGSGRTEKDKAAFSLKKNAERFKELGGDPNEILGIQTKSETVDEDDKPLTIGEWKRMQKETASKTALQLAQDIPNETERELAKWHLENTIKSTGNPSKDLELAMTHVNAVKTKQVLEEIHRKTPAKTHSTASSAPANHEADEPLTEEETQLMRFGGLTKDEVIKVRQK